MTIAEAISMADSLKPNMMTDAVKIKFLNQIDQIIWDEIISQHYPEDDRRGNRFLHAMRELIDAELELTDLQEKADVVAFMDSLRGKFHEEILKVQTIISEAKLLILQGIENTLIAKVANQASYTKDQLIGYIEDIGDTIDSETAEDPERPAYASDTSTSTVLLVSSPHDMLYVYWLITQIDHLNMEMEKYNNDRALFQNAYDQYSDWYTRTHMPIQRVREFRP